MHSEKSLLSIAAILSYMTELTVHLPEDLSSLIRRHASIDWAGIAGDAIRKAGAELELLESIASESMLTEEDALVLGKKVKRGMWEKVYRKLV